MVIGKNSIGKYVSALVLASLITGCSEAELRTLQSMTPRGTQYSKALANEYKAFASHELNVSFDEGNSAYFAHKGERAALGEGEKLEPERLEDWDLSPQTSPELYQARNRLLQAFSLGSRERYPEASAAALRYFDEWVEQTAKSWNKNQIAKTRNDFYSHLNTIEGRGTSLRTAHLGANDYEIFFKTNSATLTPDAQDMLDEVARHSAHHHILLKGETDASGSKAYNRALSKRRAEAVKNALIRCGIPDRNITIVGLGVAPRAAGHDAYQRHVIILIR